MKKRFALAAVVALVAFAAPAFAAVNPFMDVPLNHWAYDAVGQLAARGILSGYPDGTYKGNQPTTRYEMASAVARALAVVDMEKASRQDVEMLKKLVVEFKDELDALGVKVDELDGRVALLEEGVGGWKIWGEFRFDAKWADNALYTADGDTDFNLNRYRIWIRKKVDDKVTFTARFAGQGAAWDRYWIDVLLPWDVKMMAGRWSFDWEDDDKLYADNDAWFTDRALTGFMFSKNFGMAQFGLYVTHRDGRDGIGDLSGVIDAGLGAQNYEGYEWGARLRFDFNEKFWLSGNYIGWSFDNPSAFAGPGGWFGLGENSFNVWWIAAGFKFTPNWELKGAYYSESVDGLPAVIDNTASAWKLALDVKQEALKFTSLWIEYVNIDDATFSTITDGPWDNYGADVTGNQLGLYDDIWFVKAEQKWNDQWRTFQRYLKGNARFAGFSDTTNWTIGVQYYYTPALMFELAYDDISDALTVAGNDDNLIRFRTRVTF